MTSFVTPRRGIRKDDCWFYHTIDVPGEGTITGHWDLRAGAKAYLGNVEFAGQRVLEIGPASGFLTSWMEHQGAEVVAVEQPETAVWDFVPLHLKDPGWRHRESSKANNNSQLKNSFWYLHERLQLKAKVLYSRVDQIPEDVGDFDIAVLAMVLTHMRDPARAIEACARLARKKLIITERLHIPEALNDFPVMWYVPRKDTERYDTWWYFSRGFFREILTGIGFAKVEFNEIVCDVHGKAYPATTIVAEW